MLHALRSDKIYSVYHSELHEQHMYCILTIYKNTRDITVFKKDKHKSCFLQIIYLRPQHIVYSQQIIFRTVLTTVFGSILKNAHKGLRISEERRKVKRVKECTSTSTQDVERLTTLTLVRPITGRSWPLAHFLSNLSFPSHSSHLTLDLRPVEQTQGKTSQVIPS